MEEGIAICIRKDMPHTHFTLAPSVNIQNTRIHLPTSRGAITISSVYKSPILPLLDNDLDLLTTDKCLIAGDINCKSTTWGSRHSSNNGQLLERYINSRPNLILIAATEPTNTLRDLPHGILEFVIHT